MLSKLKKNISILMKGASSKDFPFYASLLTSDGSSIYTNNNDVFVNMDISLPFEGSIDIFALNGILSKIDIKHTDIFQKKNKLYIMDDKSKYELNIVKNLKIPRLEREDIITKNIDNELLECLSIASSFIGSFNPFDTMYMGDFVCASNKGDLFYYNIDIGFDVYLNRQSLSLLRVGKRFGIQDTFMIVDVNDGYLATTLPLHPEFPKDKAMEIIKNNMSNSIPICDFSEFKFAYDNLKPLLAKEKVKFINFDGDVLSVKTTIGSSKYDLNFDHEFNSKFLISIPTQLFPSIPNWYDVCINENNLNAIILTSEKSTILISTL